MTDFKERDVKTKISVLAVVQGLYFFLTGIWSIIHISSFMAITGPKVDIWLVKTVGVLVLIIGIGLIGAGIKRRISFPLAFIAAGSALGLFFIDVTYVWQGVISPIYLLDAVLEIVLVISWFIYILKTGLFTTFIEDDQVLR